MMPFPPGTLHIFLSLGILDKKIIIVKFLSSHLCEAKNVIHEVRNKSKNPLLCVVGGGYSSDPWDYILGGGR